VVVPAGVPQAIRRTLRGVARASYAGMKLKSGRGDDLTVTSSRCDHRPGHGLSGGLQIPRRVLLPVKMGTRVTTRLGPLCPAARFLMALAVGCA
jgi:hypothetical protein